MNYGRHKGYGFIYFKTEAGQKKALELDPPQVGGRKIIIGLNRK